MKSLRLKLILALLIGLTPPVAGLIYWSSQQTVKSLDRMEMAAAQQAFDRLQDAIAMELEQHEQLVKDWANWTSLARFADGTQPEFAQENLAPDALRASGFEWLAVLTPDGQLRHASSSSDQQPSDVLAGAYGPLLRSVPPADARGCVLDRSGEGWIQYCRRPIYDSTGSGPSHGLLVVGLPFAANFSDRLQRLTGLDFVLHGEDLPPPATGATLPSRPTAMGARPATYQMDSERIHLRWPILNPFDQVLGTLELEWHRTQSQQMHSELLRLQKQRFAIAALVIAGIFFLTDRIVVARLVRLNGELQRIHQKQAWEQNITVDSKDEIGALATTTNALLDLIQQQFDNLELQAATDSLTGLPNRRAYNASVRRALGTYHRHGHPLCLVMLDVDHFKLYNDHYGHVLGDQVLVKVAQCLMAQCRRAGDLPARVGGEEFAVILEDTPIDGALQWVEGLQARIAALKEPHAASPVAGTLTISLGIAAAQQDDTPDALYHRADLALYRAKSEGRNRAVVG